MPIVVAGMSRFEDGSVHTNEIGLINISLATQLAALLSHLPQSNNNLQRSVPTISLSVKLNENSYSLWSHLIRMKIEEQGNLQYLTGVPTPPDVEDPDYPQWEYDDFIVCSWILDNVEPNLVH